MKRRFMSKFKIKAGIIIIGILFILIIIAGLTKMLDETRIILLESLSRIITIDNLVGVSMIASAAILAGIVYKYLKKWKEKSYEN